MGGDMSEEHASLLEYTRSLESKIAELESHVQRNTTPASDHQVTSVTTELSTDVALLSMNATAEPFFVGATAGFGLSRMVEGILSQSPIPHTALGSIASANAQANSDVDPPMDTHSRPDPQLERKLADIFFTRVHPRYPFLDKFSFDDFHQFYLGSPDIRGVNPSKLFQLHMVFAISARILQLHPEMGGSINPEFYYANAIRYADEALQVPGLEKIQSLLLLALYILRTPGSVSNLGGWHIIGFAVRYAVELGIHRNITCVGPRAQDPYRIEIRRRVFWSAYVLDRAVSLTLGRPFALSESDIDVDLPVPLEQRPVDEKETQFKQPSAALTDTKALNLSSFVHLCRLRRLESKIKQELYSASAPTMTQKYSYDATIDALRQELLEWLNNIPFKVSADSPPQDGYLLYDTPEFFRIQYSKALRMLLQQRITLVSSEVNSSKDKEYLALSARAAGDICQYYRTLHQRKPLGWNFLALHSIFTAGLTLLYCIWAEREHADLARFEDIRSCSNVLFAISERWPTATKFRDIFEVLAKRMIDLVSMSSLPHASLDGASFLSEAGIAPAGALQDSAGFPVMNQDDFWSMLDELVDDDYIRSQFQLNGVDSSWGLFDS
ncbi:fungal-specific transcription factor domain-containing protein [Aspergillus pseudonomiae]|uniref:Fungal-specific transcription factor domain-containing protein n=1 Tax=Aspergillus pseudonomiae TaxID=1506151 RepID=A0A5N7D3L9_9EURO|nr:fungal-specific transcription factor domain-containing protein [Aspergillus pseudonomiae]KAE8401021.1 fungal-specific transcription factor domain-containing protein [Aspergillus pseudonomiae]